MAISASNTKNLYCSKYPSSGAYVISVSFTETSTNVANNTSALSLSGSIKSTGVSWDSNYDCYLKLYWYDNNTGKRTLIKTSTAFQDLGKNASKSVSGTTTVTHKADGSLSGYAVMEYVAGSTSGGYAPDSAEVQTANTALTTIARASSATVTGTALGSAVTVSISRASASFTHKVEWKIGDSSYTTASSSATTSASFTPDVSYSSQYPNSTRAACTVRVTTYNGSTQIGDAITVGCWLDVPTTVIPTCSNITFTRTDNGVPSSWGVYVKGYSKVTASISGTGIHGSTIKGYYISGAGKTSNNNTLTSDVLSSTGTYTFEATVTDSRNRTSSKKTNSITVYDYWNPSVTLTAYRCDSSGKASNTGTCLRVKAVFNYASVNGKNSITSKKITCNGKTLTSFNSGTEYTMNDVNLATTQAYTATCTVTDGMGKSATFNVSIPTSSIPFMLRDDETGACFGGYSTKTNTLESFWPLYVHGDISSNGSKVSLDGHTHDYAPASHTHDYLSKSGGTVSWLTVAGVLQPAGGQYIHYANGVSGQGGYVKIATFTVRTNYSNSPLKLQITQRGLTQVCDIHIMFNSANNTDPSLSIFRMSRKVGAYMHKSAASTWDLYIAKKENYDNLGVVDLVQNYGYNYIGVEWKNELVTTLPSGYVSATLDNSLYSVLGAMEGQSLDVLWTGSSQTPSFSISSLDIYKYFLIQTGDASSAFATWTVCHYSGSYISGNIRGIGGYETTSSTKGGEIYFIRGAFTDGVFRIDSAWLRNTATITTQASATQLYVKKILGVR